MLVSPPLVAQSASIQTPQILTVPKTTVPSRGPCLKHCRDLFPVSCGLAPLPSPQVKGQAPPMSKPSQRPPIAEPGPAGPLVLAGKV